MLVKVYGSAVFGIEATTIVVEVNIDQGIGYHLVGLPDNAVRESVHLKDISIHHIPGKINCADIFTKELKDASHFCLLRDSFMLKRSQFESLLG